MEFTKINDTSYLVPVNWLDYITCTQICYNDNEYIFDLPNNVLRNIKIDSVNNTETLITKWYNDLLSQPQNLFIYIGCDNVTLLKNLKRRGDEIRFDSYIDGKIDFKNDTLCRREHIYNISTFKTIYFIEENDFSIKYPKLINIINSNNEKPFFDF